MTATSATAPTRERTAAPRPRSLLRTVAVPDEHGGWGLTLVPVLLGLLVAPSGAGVALAATAFLAFLVRTPLRLVLVTAKPGDTAESLAGRMATTDRAVDRFLVLNGLDRPSAVKPGQSYKIVVE